MRVGHYGNDGIGSEIKNYELEIGILRSGLEGLSPYREIGICELGIFLILNSYFLIIPFRVYLSP